MILSLETATSVCSIALHDAEGNLIALQEIHQKQVHAEKLTEMIAALLKANNLIFKDLSAIAVSKGTGSYTGLRIGVATAKGLCFALDVPLIGVSTLAALALQGLQTLESLSPLCLQKNTDALLVPMIDARRMEVFQAFFEAESAQNLETDNITKMPKSYLLKEIAPPSAQILDPTTFDLLLEKYQKIYLIGKGAEKARPLYAPEQARIFFLPLTTSAKTVGKIAAQAYQKQQFEDLAYFEPFYLKDFMATISTKKLL
ncbi:tRNA (adenosine(37)-N6)-threonylcarbamoyltransferase complex dimerization subunit type 1 TsaB [Hugenholtzia roseola]|uniref:tRNA (adenosine(37)-N6)-threonylcarbamoyltransferase complex dimerization subunit type 1 TsaB n=1 Tax=Hugenholtzia roseola TaxID=1002 RepID=UPI0003F5D34D|nr:tRNA (adenosine(37)-N6)-threonylcarbamoyltransferase complex dimerization subunit type 1 TsaB [Hugenholtzia roseola]